MKIQIDLNILILIIIKNNIQIYDKKKKKSTNIFLQKYY
jgi:hypothetical protein